MDDLSYFVSLDWRGLHDLDPSIHIINVEELSPARTLQTTPSGGVGSHVLRDQINSLGVRVQFVILTDSLPRRKAVCGEVAKWCRAGKYLSISDRPGQRLRVRCTSMPVITDARDWWKPLSLTFTAYEAPWWEAISPAFVASSEAQMQHQSKLCFAGTQEESLLDVTVTAKAAVSTVSIAANGSAMTFDGLTLANGEQLVISHEDGLLVAYTLQGDVRTPCLGCRTADSSDDLTVYSCMDNIIDLTADGAVTVQMSARGRFD